MLRLPQSKSYSINVGYFRPSVRPFRSSSSSNNACVWWQRGQRAFQPSDRWRIYLSINQIKQSINWITGHTWSRMRSCIRIATDSGVRWFGKVYNIVHFFIYSSIYLIKHQRQRAQATYMPVKSTTIVHHHHHHHHYHHRQSSGDF